MTVMAKFRVEKVIIFRGQIREVFLNPVNGSSANPDNASWSKYTPSGTLNMLITNPDVYNQFEPGNEFFLTFSPTEVPKN